MAQGLSGFGQKFIFTYLHASQCQKGVQKVYGKSETTEKKPMQQSIKQRPSQARSLLLFISKTIPPVNLQAYCINFPLV